MAKKAGANSSDQKLIFKMAADDMKPKEIAKALGIPVATVNSFIKLGKTNREFSKAKEQVAEKADKK